jgi:hypothetical protein
LEAHLSRSHPRLPIAERPGETRDGRRIAQPGQVASASSATRKNAENHGLISLLFPRPVSLHISSVTLDQIEKRKQKGADFARNVLQNDDLANDLEDESAESYAERKHLKISNSGRRTMANGNNGMSKGDLRDMVDQIEQIASDAYQPETDRETAIAALSDILNVIEGDGDEDEDDDQDDDGQ